MSLPSGYASSAAEMNGGSGELQPRCLCLRRLALFVLAILMALVAGLAADLPEGVLPPWRASILAANEGGWPWSPSMFPVDKAPPRSWHQDMDDGQGIDEGPKNNSEGNKIVDSGDGQTACSPCSLPLSPAHSTSEQPLTQSPTALRHSPLAQPVPLENPRTATNLMPASVVFASKPVVSYDTVGTSDCKLVPAEWLNVATLPQCKDSAPRRGLLVIGGADTVPGFGMLFFLFPLNHFLLAEAHCLVPVVRFTHHGAQTYWDPKKKLQNPWECFFRPIGRDAKPSLPKFCLNREQRSNALYYSADWAVRTWYFGKSSPASIIRYNEPWYRKQRQTAASLLPKYFHLQPWVLDEASRLWDAHFPKGVPVLGLHYRGADKSGKRMRRDSVMAYLGYVKAFLEANPRGKVMLATDDFDTQTLIMDSVWPKPVRDVIVMPQPMTNTSIDRADNKDIWKRSSLDACSRGRVVLLDIVLLSRCDYLIYGQSTVSEVAIWMNMGLHERSVPIFAINRPPATKHFFSKAVSSKAN
mmetsp:Transcript_88400/g.249090  ORF Transcript_88400/g.249090 Transcript_88400/m.249090 type:complete len:527 (-) Transcript_88400:146-1726(-)|eukprot:CAMPEP_0117474776 /NCGR_PEP_ID=MMETSP0784-20121206/9456_1 /TAXON_ID=39447 /ORGANISM="" /LENGTH=526 /DNA_ID=CAMNT_0005269007 /DNA_START=41 /DNA_END=1621 /DNA_ORIENTATION=-